MKCFRIFSFLIFITYTFFSLSAQNNGCNGLRYKNEVFDIVKVTTSIYGRNVSVIPNQDSLNLFMDVYEPVGDVAPSRPAIVLAFGGAYVTGDRTQLSDLGRYYARLGYVAACIDYRIYPIFVLGFPDSLAIMDIAFKAISDMKASIRYLRSTATQFKIDTNLIFAGGISAGSISAIQSTYLHVDDSLPPYIKKAMDANGGFQGNSNPATLKWSTRVSGVMNLSGAIVNPAWIRATDPPMVSFHGTADQTVPYGSGRAAGLITVNGSGIIHPVLKSKKIKELLISVPNGGHTDIYFEPQYAPYLDSFLLASRKFFGDIICPPIISDQSNLVKTNVVIFPNPASEYINIRSDEKVRSVRLCDILGRSVPVSLKDNRIDLITNAGKTIPGVYILEIRFDQGQVSTTKLSIQ